MNPTTSTSSSPGHGFIPAYKALPTALARHQLLQSLVQQLSSEDCHTVSDLIYARLHVDILGRLPLELAAEIASCLPPWDIFRYRSVSKRWNELLSSPAACSSSFYSYFPQPQQSLPFDTSKPDWSRQFRQLTKRRLALVTGRPYSLSFFPQRGCQTGGKKSLVSYHDGMIAHDPDSRTIRLLSVVDGPIATYQTVNRESFYKTALSCTAVAAVTIEGYCHVWNYKTGDEGSFRLPSRALRLVLDEDAVAVQLEFPSKSTVIITWDLRSRQAREIKHASRILHMFLSARDSSLVLVHTEDETPQNCNVDKDILSVVGTRYLLKGAVPTLQDVTTYFRLSLKGPKIFNDVVNVFGNNDRCVLAFSQCLPDVMPQAGDERKRYRLVVLNPRKYQHKKQQKQHPSRPSPNAAAATCPDVIYCGDLFEDFTFFYYLPNASAVGTTLDQSEIEEIRRDEYIEVGLSEPPVENYLKGGDDRFIIRMNERGFYVWCFDEDITLYQEVEGYRSSRKRRAEERARRRERGASAGEGSAVEGGEEE
ncbi:hypothetical protein GX51_04708 [Blastomyces parvus]|uniref:F-box domain-containing protein n=1 Tax=Blastomyces parvus TaxID=2060905 RepID=A0A2B7X0P2_9EURO|nr:hypothetical protein GX51_04708 [Blastomyces parvus]